MGKIKQPSRIDWALCPRCGCWHGLHPLEHLQPGVPCEHDRSRPCRICGHPVGDLSTGGPEVCVFCQSGYLREPEVEE